MLGVPARLVGWMINVSLVSTILLWVIITQAEVENPTDPNTPYIDARVTAVH